jgi:hypothetical protein
MKKGASSRRKRRRTKSKRAVPAVQQRPQDAVNPALFESGEKEAEADADPSVEDPLQDWPELEAEKDEWLVERNGDEDEPPDR